MFVSLGLPTHRVDLGEEFVSAAGIGELAMAAERAGFDAVFVTDHPAPSADWMRRGGHHALDPFVALSFAAAVTSQLRLQTHVLIATYRHPLLVAKAVASLDALSGGRMILGLASGYLEAEFSALGVDFAARNDLLDAAIDTMVQAWTEQGVADQPILPLPVQRPHPPIWVGGNSHRAIRRAVERGDGWVPFPSPPGTEGALRTPAMTGLADLRERLDYAKRHADAVGRDRPLDVITAAPGWGELVRAADWQAEQFAAAAQALAGAGGTGLAMTFPARSRTQTVELIEQFGRDVLPAIAAI